MLGFIGRWAQSKGMKILPNWIGYNKDTVQANVIAEGFAVGQFIQSDSDLQAEEVNHNKVISQSPTEATLQDYETSVDLTWRNFAFTPFSVFGFSPFSVFSFTPAPYFKWNPPLFVPTFSFTPFSVFSFTPYCVDEETPITIVGANDSIAFKAAKDISIGDEVWAMLFDEYIDEDQGVSVNSFSSPELTNRRMEKTTIKNILPSTKTQTIYFNDDIYKRFSLQENILIKRNGLFAFVESGSVQVGDLFVKHNQDGSFIETIVDSIHIIDESRTVYKFNAEPIDHLIAGGMVVHNVKD